MVSVVLVGTGGFGRHWAHQVGKHSGWRLAGAVDLNAEAAASVAAELGIPAFPSLGAARAATGARVVICVVPPKAHKAVALEAFHLGMDVITEKPLADSLEEAREMIAAARQAGRRLVVSQNYRWRPHIAAIKEAIANGLIGEIGSVEWHFRRASKFSGWRDQYDEILLEDMSIHHIDLIRHLTGRDGILVSAVTYRPDWSWFRGRPCANVQIWLEGGIPVSYIGSWVAWGRQTPWDGEARITGTKGAIELVDNVPLLYPADAFEPQPLPLPEMAYTEQAYVLEEYLRSESVGRPHATEAADNFHSLALIAAAVRSAATGEQVQVERWSKP